MAAAAAAVASAAWSSSYAGAVLVLTLVATVGATAVAIVASRSSSAVRLPIALGGLVVLLAGAGAITGALDGRGPATGALAGITSVVNGWGEALATAVPVPLDPDLVAPPAVTTYVAAFAAVALARSRVASGWVGAITIALAAVAWLFAEDGTADEVVIPFLVLTLLLAFFALNSARPEQGAFQIDTNDVARTAAAGSTRRRRSLTGIAAVGAILLSSTWVAPSLPGWRTRDPVTLRDYVDPPPNQFDVISPLAEAQAMGLVSAEQVMFVVDSTDPSGRWRVATLDHYDGVGWSSGATYERAGDALPADPLQADDTGTDRRRENIRIAELASPFLPVTDRPVRVEPSEPIDLLVDVGTGGIASADGALPSGTTVRVTSETPQIDPARFLSSPAVSGDVAAPYLGLPDSLDPGVRALSAAATEGALTPFGRAAAIEAFLRENGVVDPDAPGGQLLRQLTGVLADTPPYVGTVDQLAAAFVLLARSQGLPSRLVVGFQGGTQRGDDTVEVTGAHAHVWAEVLFDGVGWVPFFPTQPPVQGPDQLTPETVDSPLEEAKASAESTVEEQPPDPEITGPPDGPGDDVPTDHGSVPMPVVIASLSALVLAVPALAIVGMKRRRRRRRASGSPDERVVGAWLESRDRLSAVGSPSLPSYTADDVVEHARACGLEALEDDVRALGVAAERSVFDNSTAEEPDAAAAWAAHDRIVRLLRQTVGPRRRLRAALEVRTLARRPDPYSVLPAAGSTQAGSETGESAVPVMS